LDVALPFQREGIHFLQTRTRALLADDAGLGKSMQMIGAADAAGCERILVLPPTIGRVSWKLQFGAWDKSARPVWVFPGETCGLIPDGPLAMIVTLDWLSDRRRTKTLLRAMSTAQPFDAAFIDEAHNLKNPKANRTKAVYGPKLDLVGGVLADVATIYAATATFTPLNAGEIYSHLRALFPQILLDLFQNQMPSHQTFVERFCMVEATSYGDVIRGNNPATIPDLRHALEPVLILRTKEAVLPQLPTLRTSRLPLDVADADMQRLARETADLSDDDFLAAVALAYGSDTAYSTRRRAMGVLKAKAALPWIIDYLENDPTRKLIVFAHHREVIQTLCTELSRYEPVTIHGGTRADDDAFSVKCFQNRAQTRVFIGQNRAANTAVTLTAADHVLLLEPDPSPSQNYQALSRAHRIGQASSVHGLFAYGTGNPIEARMVSIIRRRATDNQELFGVETPGAHI
jgi:SWI/SNF-related matrix-associated actin-dependent regulator 1 of chromatin subfamily A